MKDEMKDEDEEDEDEEEKEKEKTGLTREKIIFALNNSRSHPH